MTLVVVVVFSYRRTLSKYICAVALIGGNALALLISLAYRLAHVLGPDTIVDDDDDDVNLQVSLAARKTGSAN